MKKGTHVEGAHDRLVRALEVVALPPRHDKISFWAEQLADAGRQAFWEKHSRKHGAAIRTARHKLQRLAKLASEAKEEVQALPASVRIMLDEERWAFIESVREEANNEGILGPPLAGERFDKQLEDLILAVERADDIFSQMTFGTQGRRDQPAFGVALITGVSYQQLSKRSPGRSVSVVPSCDDERTGKEGGPFLNLLREVYSILKIDADPVRQARNVSEWWRDPQNQDIIMDS